MTLPAIKVLFIEEEVPEETRSEYAHSLTNETITAIAVFQRDKFVVFVWKLSGDKQLDQFTIDYLYGEWACDRDILDPVLLPATGKLYFSVRKNEGYIEIVFRLEKRWRNLLGAALGTFSNLEKPLPGEAANKQGIMQ